MSLQIFTTRDLYRLLAILDELEGSGVSDIRFARERVSNQIHSNMRSVKKNIRRPINKSLKCLECNGPAIKQPVNISKCTQTGNPADKFAIICRNKDCMHTEFIS